MTQFQHKTLPITISYTEYSKLDKTEKENFMIVNSAQPVTSNIATTTVNSETKDLLGLGQVAETVVAVPLVIGAALFGLFD